MRQIAGPNTRLPRALAAFHADIDGNGYFLALHMARHRRFFIAGHDLAVPRHFDPANGNGQFIARGFFARFADRHDNAPPISIGAGNGGFHQRRIANGQRNLARRRIIFSAADFNGHEFGNALAIARHLLREILHEVRQGFFERGQPFIVSAFYRRAVYRLGAGGDQQTRIRG